MYAYAAVQDAIVDELNIASDTPESEVLALVQASPYAKDYNLTHSRICYLRTKHINVHWMNSPRDIDSCIWAVRSVRGFVSRVFTICSGDGHCC